jgi:RNA polymerase sigma factor (sigma-70 family)
MAGRNLQRTHGTLWHTQGLCLHSEAIPTLPAQAAVRALWGRLGTKTSGSASTYGTISRYNGSAGEAQAERAVSANAWDEIQLVVERVLEAECAGDGGHELEAIRDRLIDLLRPQIRAMLRALTRDHHLVEDLVQEALLHLWAKIPQYNPKIAPFKHWAGRVVINYAYNMLERHLRITRHEVRESEWLPPDADEETPSPSEWAASSDPDPTEQVSERERLELILACARDALNDEEYLVWLEQIVNGSSYRQIAELLDRTENWARQTMLRARQKVAAAIILHPSILSEDEVRAAIARCMQSAEPLTQAELALLQETLQHDGSRKPPGWRQLNLFRQACVKILAHLLGCLLLIVSSL